MGTSKPNNNLQAEDKKDFTWKEVTKRELEGRRVQVYSYLL